MTTIDFAGDNQFHHLFYREPTPEQVKEFSRFLREHRNEFVWLYHGTAKSLHEKVLKKGLLPTSPGRKRSYQSSPGYVYLSVYQSSARNFGAAAYPGQEVVVYRVWVPIRRLLPDRDQLRNQRLFGGREVGDTLAESLVFGHGARVNKKILPTQLSIWTPHKKEAQ